MKGVSGSLGILIAAIALGLAAGLGGAWLGLSNAKGAETFPQVVSQLLQNSAAGLSPPQHARIEQLRQNYEAERQTSGRRLQNALVSLAEAVVQTPDGSDQVEAAADLVDRIVHERRMASIRYITDARATLNPDQRAAFDKAFLQVVANDPSYPR